MTDQWTRLENEYRRQQQERYREMIRGGGGGGCVLYPLGAIALVGLCCASPSLLENVHLPFSIPHFGGSHVVGPPPKQVVQDYLVATVEQKTPSAAALTCAVPQLDSVATWWEQSKAVRMRWTGLKYHLTFDVDTGSVKGDHASVSATATETFTKSGGDQPSQQKSTMFAFTLSNESGWKVCAATVS